LFYVGISTDFFGGPNVGRLIGLCPSGGPGSMKFISALEAMVEVEEAEAPTRSALAESPQWPLGRV
jgi:hypothetical protein